MARVKFFKSAAFILTVMLLWCAADKPGYADKKIRAILTIPPQSEFVKKIGGDHVEVDVMVPKTGDPHTYEPAPLQLKTLAGADFYFEIGSGIEFELAWMDKIASLNKNMAIVNTSGGIELLDGDPHVWLSPKNVMIMAENIRDALILKDPAHSARYQENAEKYIKELTDLDANIKEKLSGKKNRVIMVFHSSWRYFARDYGLKEIAIEAEGKEPTIGGMKKVIDEAREIGVKTIFISPEFSRKSAEAVAEEIGANIVMVYPLKKYYIENLRNMADMLRKELN